MGDEPPTVIRIQPTPVTERERLLRRLAEAADVMHMDDLRTLVDGAEYWAFEVGGNREPRLRLATTEECIAGSIDGT